MRHSTHPRTSLFLLCLLAACGGGDDDTTQAASIENVLHRERAAHYAAQAEWGRVRKELEPLVADDGALIEDLVSAATTELQLAQLDATRALLDRVAARDPDNAARFYLLGRIASLEGDMVAAEEHFRAALAAAPGDLATRFNLARSIEEQETETDAEWDANLAEARGLFEEILDGGIEHGGMWYVSSSYRMFFMSNDLDDPAQRERYQGLWYALKDLGAKPVDNRALNNGELAAIRPPRPAARALAGAPAAPVFELDRTVASPAGATRVALHDLDGDRRSDLVTCGPGGLFVAIQRGDGTFRGEIVVAGAVDGFAAIDLNQDDDWDLVHWTGARLSLQEHDEGAWTESPVALPELPSAIADLAPVDYDHDGDLDLLLAGAFGARLLRNDGAGQQPEQPDAPRGGWTDVTAEAGLPTAVAYAWCAIEDVDADQDVDLLFGGPGGVYLADSLRRGRFADRSAVLGGVAMPSEPLFADLDGDARMDALVPGDPGRLLLQQDDGTLAGADFGLAVPASALVPIDLDLDGALDVLWSEDGRAGAGILAIADGRRAPFELPTNAGAGPITGGDVDFSRGPELANEVVRAGPEGIEIWRSTSPVGGGVRLRYLGLKDNRQAIGAVVELRARDVYRRVFWTGDAQLLGVGDLPFVDIVRITWPNGIVASDLDLELGDQQFLDDAFGVQPEGLIGSCPFLYTWNGTTFTFISDVLGITPLGLPMAPGMLVPPDHDELVLVRGDQLVPRDGFFELQFTEELREVTYLDRIRLDVVDHPAGTEIFPDERFCFPPFPAGHVHSVRAPVAARRVTGSDGADWTAALASLDEVHAAPFEALTGQFQGLATPHHLELAFDPDVVRDAKKLRLVCTGWFFWTDASVNVAAAYTPGVDFVPPTISLPTADGGWAPAGPPVGFPAGKTKTMVVDVTDLLDRADPRLRLSSSLRLYWDQIVLAVDDDDAEQRVTSLEPSSALLWERGFSAPLEADCDTCPERFVWDVLAERARWDQHPGRYTRLGETLPLVGAVDDMFVILGAGDALTVRFDARALPPPPEGYVRDYLVYLDGWAKDRDPNTVEALEVEPLPFHGMSGYPYGPDESFPNGPAHRAWRSEWNTRPARALVPPLAPRRFDEWVAAELEQ